MNLNTSTIPAAIGAAFAGGFYAGTFSLGGETFALIVSPAASGTLKGKWNSSNDAVEGARHYADGLANTQAMAAAGSELATQALALTIDGLGDWYIPSRDELELIYRNLKPTEEENGEYYRSGENASSLPVGYAYTENLPLQTTADAFKEGAGEALADGWHWSSTQYAPDPSDAWLQNFSYGDQTYYHKSNELRARAVRRLKI